MLGAIAGDVIGSVYESYFRIKTKDFPLFTPHSQFTDDTVLTIATAESILLDVPFEVSYRKYYRLYPKAGYGYLFSKWGKSETAGPYNSWGNGSAMRVSPIGYAYDNLDEVLSKAEASAAVTHSHPEGIKGAQALAAAVFLARKGMTKDEIKFYVTNKFNYDLSRSLDDIRPSYRFDVSCAGSVPEAIISFLESTDYEDAVRNAISLGGDADTLACMAGAIAEAHYKVIPEEIALMVMDRLESGSKTPTSLTDVLHEFRNKYMSNGYQLDCLQPTFPQTEAESILEMDGKMDESDILFEID